MNQQLTQEHLQTVLDFRFEMMREAELTGVLADDWREKTAEIYTGMWRDGRGMHVGAFRNGKLVACSGCIIRDDFPFPTLKARRFGWIMDVYVMPEYRKLGIAKELTALTMDWLYAKGIRVIKLSASPQAKTLRLYHKLGFTETNEMILRKP